MAARRFWPKPPPKEEDWPHKLGEQQTLPDRGAEKLGDIPIPTEPPRAYHPSPTERDPVETDSRTPDQEQERLEDMYGPGGELEPGHPPRSGGELYYKRGGMVGKHGSPTRVSCSPSKVIRRG